MQLSSFIGCKIWTHSANEAPPCGPLAAARGCHRCDAVQSHSVSLCQNVSVSGCQIILLYMYISFAEATKEQGRIPTNCILTSEPPLTLHCTIYIRVCLDFKVG